MHSTLNTPIDIALRGVLPSIDLQEDAVGRRSEPEALRLTDHHELDLERRSGRDPTGGAIAPSIGTTSRLCAVWSALDEGTSIPTTRSNRGGGSRPSVLSDGGRLVLSSAGDTDADLEAWRVCASAATSAPLFVARCVRGDRRDAVLRPRSTEGGRSGSRTVELRLRGPSRVAWPARARGTALLPPSRPAMTVAHESGSTWTTSDRSGSRSARLRGSDAPDLSSADGRLGTERHCGRITVAP